MLDRVGAVNIEDPGVEAFRGTLSARAGEIENHLLVETLNKAIERSTGLASLG